MNRIAKLATHFGPLHPEPWDTTLTEWVGIIRRVDMHLATLYTLQRTSDATAMLDELNKRFLAAERYKDDGIQGFMITRLQDEIRRLYGSARGREKPAAIKDKYANELFTDFGRIGERLPNQEKIDLVYFRRPGF